MQLPLQNITFVISPVLHPILSSLQDNRCELGEKNLHLLVVLSQISFPLGFILYFCAFEIVMIVFGPNWEPSVPVFKVLALSLPLQILLSTSGSLFQAAGKTNHMFYIGLCNTIVTVVGFMIAALYFKTLTAMAWAWDITLLINFVNSYLAMNRFTFGFPLTRFFGAFLPQLINSIISVSIAYILIDIIHIDNLIFETCYKILAVGLPTLLIAYLLGQYNIIKLISKIWRSIRRR